MSIARRIRDLRYIKGWGPDDLASRAKISRTALYQIESGKTESPRAGTVRRIAKALGVPPEALILDREGPIALAERVGPSVGSVSTRGQRPDEATEARRSEVERKIQVLLESPLAEGVSKLIDDMYRMLPIGYHMTESS